MLAFNKILQKAGELTSVRFNRVRYFQSEAISVLFTKNTDAIELLKTQTNRLI